MNKLFIGLLIAAAGAGAFFLLRKKSNTPQIAELNKEWIFGKWKVDSYQPVKDSNSLRSRYDFDSSGLVVRTLDSLKQDSSRYHWNKKDELVMTEGFTDSLEYVYSVLKLTPDTLHIRSADSVVILFTKMK
jgi:hypothetical protein